MKRIRFLFLLLTGLLFFCYCDPPEPEIIHVTGVTLNKTAIELTVGDAEQLTATVAPADATNKSVTWSSNNGSVATVDANGRVTAVSAGSATITVKTEDGGKTATCAVTVKNPVIHVTGVTLNRDVMDLYVGDTGQLKATVTPEDATDKSVTWQSSDNAVATVDAGGLVTARSSGSAYIRVYTKDLGFTAACRVRVTLFIAVEKVTVVDIQQRDTSRIAVGKTLQLYANVEPYDATEQTVTWTSSDEEVATVDGNGQVTTLKAGTVRITATAGGKSGFYQLTVADSGNENFNQGGSLGWD